MVERIVDFDETQVRFLVGSFFSNSIKFIYSNKHKKIMVPLEEIPATGFTSKDIQEKLEPADYNHINKALNSRAKHRLFKETSIKRTQDYANLANQLAEYKF